MKVVAPGKVMLMGAYSVLEGTPALVAAVDRYAVADTARLEPSISREVRAAIGDEPAPTVDVTALHKGGDKLGLGSSAAALVATLGARAALRGADLADAGVRLDLFRAARRAHAEAQGGGSGVDVAASTFGGALFYRMDEASSPFPLHATLPGGLTFRVFWSGRSARTSDLLAKVRRLASNDPAAYGRAIEDLGGGVADAMSACDEGDLRAFVGAGQRTSQALEELGRLADAPIFPQAFKDLATLAVAESAAFFPSGAGGGDVGVWLSADPPSELFLTQARTYGMLCLDVGMDHAGVRTRRD